MYVYVGKIEFVATDEQTSIFRQGFVAIVLSNACIVLYQNFDDCFNP